MSNALRTGRPNIWNAEKIAQLLDLRQKGLPSNEMAQALGISEKAVTTKLTLLRKMGVPIPKRPTGTPAGYKPALPYRKPGLIDYSDRRDAETRGQVQARAQALMRFWHRKGATHVTAWVEETGKDRSGGTIFSLRSNLINGLPPKQHPAIRQSTAAE